MTLIFGLALKGHLMLESRQLIPTWILLHLNLFNSQNLILNLQIGQALQMWLHTATHKLIR